MPSPAPRPDPQADMRALCHRLGSPLGTLVNHLYLLGLDRDELSAAAQGSLDAARTAVTSLSEVLENARRWIHAHVRSVDGRPVSGTELTEILGSTVPAGSCVQLDPDALADVLADLAADGEAEGVTVDDDGVLVSYVARADRRVDLDRPGGALDPFGPVGTAPRWAAARVLSERLGAVLAVDRAPDGTPRARLHLPFDLEGGEGEHDE